MKLQEKRREVGLEQTQLAKMIGTNAPMISNFEHYNCLPTPSMLTKICEILKCKELDIYSKDELYISVGQEKTPTKKKEIEKTDIYTVAVNLPNRFRDILSRDNLAKCGYQSLKDFIWCCSRKFEKRLKNIEKKTAESKVPAVNECTCENNSI